MSSERKDDQPEKEEGSGGWGWGWDWGSSALMSAATALGDTANQLVNVIVDDGESHDSSESKVLNQAGHDEDSDGVPTDGNAVVSTEEDAGELIEKSIWNAVTFLGNAIQESSLYDGLTKSAQAFIDGVQTTDYEKGMDLSFATLEAVGKKAADMLSLEVEDIGASPAQPVHEDSGIRGKETTSVAEKREEVQGEGEPSTFDANFEECLGTVNLQALEDICTQSLISIEEMDQAFKSNHASQMERVKELLEQEEEEHEHEHEGSEGEIPDEDENSSDAKQARLRKRIDEIQQKINLNRKARTRRKILDAFMSASLSLGPGKVTEFEVALKAKLAQHALSEENAEKGDDTKGNGQKRAEEIVKLVEAHLERCFAKSMMILSELSASSVEVFLRVGESYLSDNQQKGGNDKYNEQKEEGQDLLPIQYHIELINLLKRLFSAEVAQICSSFADSLSQIAAVGKDALSKEEKVKEEGGEGESQMVSPHEEELDNKVRGYIQDIYTNYAAKCHSFLHEASKQLIGVCQLLLLKYAAKG